MPIYRIYSKVTFVQNLAMKRIIALLLICCSAIVYGQKSKTVKKANGSYLILNGGAFKGEKIILSPIETGYNNKWYPKYKYTDFNMSGKWNNIIISIGVRIPGQKDTYTISNGSNIRPTGSQRNDLNVYVQTSDNNYIGQPDSLTITVTCYDEVGGLIEADIKGTIKSGSSRNQQHQTIDAHLSIVRLKDGGNGD